MCRNTYAIDPLTVRRVLALLSPPDEPAPPPAADPRRRPGCATAVRLCPSPSGVPSSSGANPPGCPAECLADTGDPGLCDAAYAMGRLAALVDRSAGAGGSTRDWAGFDTGYRAALSPHDMPLVPLKRLMRTVRELKTGSGAARVAANGVLAATSILFAEILRQDAHARPDAVAEQLDEATAVLNQALRQIRDLRTSLLTDVAPANGTSEATTPPRRLSETTAASPASDSAATRRRHQVSAHSARPPAGTPNLGADTKVRSVLMVQPCDASACPANTEAPISDVMRRAKAAVATHVAESRPVGVPGANAEAAEEPDVDEVPADEPVGRMIADAVALDAMAADTVAPSRAAATGLSGDAHENADGERKATAIVTLPGVELRDGRGRRVDHVSALATPSASGSVPGPRLGSGTKASENAARSAPEIEPTAANGDRSQWAKILPFRRPERRVPARSRQARPRLSGDSQPSRNEPSTKVIALFPNASAGRTGGRSSEAPEQLPSTPVESPEGSDARGSGAEDRTSAMRSESRDAGATGWRQASATPAAARSDGRTPTEKERDADSAQDESGAATREAA